MATKLPYKWGGRLHTLYFRFPCSSVLYLCHLLPLGKYVFVSNFWHRIFYIDSNVIQDISLEISQYLLTAFAFILIASWLLIGWNIWPDQKRTPKHDMRCRDGRRNDKDNASLSIFTWMKIIQQTVWCFFFWFSAELRRWKFDSLHLTIINVLLSELALLCNAVTSFNKKTIILFALFPAFINVFSF